MKFIILALFVSLSSVASNQEKEDLSINRITSHVQMPQFMESREVFMKALSNPLVLKLFRESQGDLFSDQLDKDIKEFITEDPNLAQLMNIVRTSYSKIMEQYYLSFLTEGTAIVPGMTPEYDRLYKINRDVAVDLGFKEEAIRNMKLIVLSGTDNAFTFSGLENEMYIVYQRDILRNLSNGEIRAVSGHELVHILREHVIVGQINQVMLNLLGIYLTKSANSKLDTSEASEIWEKTSKSPFVQMKSSIKHFGHDHDGHEKAVHYDLYKSVSPVASSFRSSLNSFVSSFLAQSEEFQRKVFVEYIDMLVKNLQAKEAFSETILFLKSVRKDLADPKAYFRLASESEVGFHLKAIEFLASQAFETSSDHGANSVVRRDFLASAMAKLMGADFSGSKSFKFSNREERKRIIDNLLLQAKIVRHNIAGDQAAFELQMLSHPKPVIRVEQIMHLERYPAILFADPFLRVLHLRDLMVRKILALNDDLERLDAGIVNLADAKPEVQKKVNRFRKALVATIESYTNSKKNLDEDLLRMVLDPSKGGLNTPYRTYESQNEMSAGFDLEDTRKTLQSPRFQSYYGYYLNFKREILIQMQRLKEDIELAEVPEAKELLEFNLKILEKHLAEHKNFASKILTSSRELLNSQVISDASRDVIVIRGLKLEQAAQLLTPDQIIQTYANLESESDIKEIAPIHNIRRPILLDHLVEPKVNLPRNMAAQCQKYFL